MRRSDLTIISFFSGASMVMFFVGILFLWIPDHKGDYEDERIVASVQVLRFSFLVIYVLFAAGVNIKIFTAYKINYLYIFEIDQRHKMNSD